MEKHNIIPKPVNALIEDGFFALDNTTAIVSDQNSVINAKYLKSLLNIEIGLNLAVKPLSNEKELQNAILLKISNEIKDKNSEYYILNVSQSKLTISATTQKGIFYGIQTLRQLLHPDNENSEVSISCIKIEDYPRFPWRGFMLDESRHFFGKETVKKILDLMGLFKLNVFHWHLTDDQGWRVEIGKYPLLIKIGSQRKNAKISSHRRKSKPRKSDEFIYSGYYHGYYDWIAMIAADDIIHASQAVRNWKSIHDDTIDDILLQEELMQFRCGGFINPNYEEELKNVL